MVVNLLLLRLGYIASLKSDCANPPVSVGRANNTSSVNLRKSPYSTDGTFACCTTTGRVGRCELHEPISVLMSSAPMDNAVGP